MDPKREIRRIKAQLRNDLPADLRRRHDGEIVSRVARHPFFVTCGILLCYVACRGEVDLSRLMEIAWQAGKRVAVPRVRADQEISREVPKEARAREISLNPILVNHEMDFYEIQSFSELSPGYAGILEPMQGKILVEVKQGESVLALLPGLAFDKAGNRLGYGKGFYDRYLEQNPGFYTMGIAYSVQCEKTLPTSPHDRKVQAVMTELGDFMG